jgi:peptidoglycan hydrolase-like protein with peptidoglycan-binding domain
VPDNQSECRRAQSRATRRPLTLAAVIAAAFLVLGSAGAVAQQSADGASAEPRAAKASGHVRAAQRKLGLTADGVVGPRTRRAIKRFQRRNDLPVTGALDPATVAALGLDGLRATPPTVTGEASARLEAIARCESGGDPAAVSADGQYRGKYQFSRATWRSMGGKGDPAAAPEAEQDRRAALLLRRQGPSAWPSCAR